MDLRRISAIVTCHNEEPNIGKCLESLRGFGEIIIVDSFSTDQTVEIARRFPSLIFMRKYISAANQKNWAISLARSEWVFILDSDEVLGDELREELLSLDFDADVHGFWIRRRSSFMGRVIKYCGWQRDKVLRLFNREKGKYREVAVHEEIDLKGRSGTLKGRIYHFPYRDLNHHLIKMRDYTYRGAIEYRRSGGRFAILNMLLHPPFRFIRMYFLQLGFLDGRAGLTLSALASYAVFLKYKKAMEIRHCPVKN